MKELKSIIEDKALIGITLLEADGEYIPVFSIKRAVWESILFADSPKEGVQMFYEDIKDNIPGVWVHDLERNSELP